MNRIIIALFALASIVGNAYANGVHKAAANDKVARAQAIIDQNAVAMPLSTFNWANRIALGGQANIELAWGDNSPIGSFARTHSAIDLMVNNANLIADAKINSWMQAHMNLAYTADALLMKHFMDPRYWDTTGSFVPVIPKIGAKRDRLSVDEAYVTISNFARSPFYARVGKQYVPFGCYEPYPVFIPFTQILSQIRQTALTVGAVTDFGLYGSVYVFNGHHDQKNAAQKNNSIRNFGAQLGYQGSINSGKDINYNVEVDWIRNIQDMDILNYYADVMARLLIPHPLDIEGHTGGVAAHGYIGYGPFSLWANYVTALEKLYVVGVPSGGTLNLRPWAFDVNGSYAFNTFNYASKVGLSYQRTGNFDDMPMPFNPTIWIPKTRYMVDYMVNLCKNADATLAYAHDVLYSKLHNSASNEKSANTVILRLGVKF